MSIYKLSQRIPKVLCHVYITYHKETLEYSVPSLYRQHLFQPTVFWRYNEGGIITSVAFLCGKIHEISRFIHSLFSITIIWTYTQTP
jgi:hypothetical protein